MLAYLIGFFVMILPAIIAARLEKRFFDALDREILLERREGLQTKAETVVNKHKVKT